MYVPVAVSNCNCPLLEKLVTLDTIIEKLSFIIKQIKDILAPVANCNCELSLLLDTLEIIIQNQTKYVHMYLLQNSS